MNEIIIHTWNKEKNQYEEQLKIETEYLIDFNIIQYRDRVTIQTRNYNKEENENKKIEYVYMNKRIFSMNKDNTLNNTSIFLD